MDRQARITEIEQFIGYVIEQWPRDRARYQDQIAQRCTRCILSDRCAPIEDGLCAHCRAFEAASEPDPATTVSFPGASEEAIGAVLSRYAGAGAQDYDALVMFSGGKDSAYVLHRLRTEFASLRVLAVTVDNGFLSPVAMDNVQRALPLLEGVDHMVYRARPRLYAQTFRHAFTHLNEGGCYATVDRMDGDLTLDIGRNLAASMRIPLLVIGLSPPQVGGILGLSTFETTPAEEARRRTTAAGFDLEALYASDDWKYWWDGTRWPAESVPHVLYPFCGWNYDEQQIRGDVVRLGLVGPNQDNPLITNNDTIPLMLAVDSMFLGFSGFEPEFARLVRGGGADRNFWLAVCEALELLTRQ